MSEHTKKHPTKTKQQPSTLYVVNNDGVYAIPKKIAQRYKVDAKRAVSKPDNISTDEVFAAGLALTISVSDGHLNYIKDEV